MKMISVTLLLIAALTLLSCRSESEKNDKKVMVRDAISHGFNCVTPLSGAELTQAQLDQAYYQETAPSSGKFVPKGWQPVTNGTYEGCYVPAMGHVGDTTIKP
jgi:hypothetical protein